MVLFSLILPAGIATSRDAAATSSITFPLDDADVYRHIRLLDISFARTYETEIYFNRSTASIPSNVNPDGTIGTPMLPVGNARTSEIGSLDELPNFFDLTVNVPVPTVRNQTSDQAKFHHLLYALDQMRCWVIKTFKINVFFLQIPA